MPAPAAPRFGSLPDNPLRALRRWIRRQPWLRRQRRRAFTALVRALLAFARHAPRGLVEVGLDALARLAWHALPRERGVAQRQLALAFPQWAPERREAAARVSLRLLAANLIDGIRGDRGVWIADPELSRLRELAEAPQPLLLLCAHQGAWELLGIELARRLPRFAVIAAEPHNRAVGRILRESRRSRGLESFDRERDTLRAVRFLRRGGVLAVLADHRSRAASVHAEWFGRPAPTLRAPGLFARRLGATVLAVGIRRDAAGHRIVLGPALRHRGEDDPTFARRCNAALEEIILASPLEWTWIHDRYGEAPS